MHSNYYNYSIIYPSHYESRHKGNWSNFSNTSFYVIEIR